MCYYKTYVFMCTHTATAPRQHARSHLLLCTWPTHGRLWPSITGKQWNYLTSDQCGAPGLISTTPLMWYFSYFAAKSMYFLANKHKPRGSVHTTLLPRLRAHHAVFILKLPPGLTHGCSDFRYKVIGSTSERRSLWKGLFLQRSSWKMPISLSAIWSYCG